MAMEPVMFTILHYKRPQNQESIDMFENELHQYTKKSIVYKGKPIKRNQSEAASEMGSVVQSVFEKEWKCYNLIKFIIKIII